MPKPKALTPLEEQAVLNMHREGLPIAEIAYTHKISASTVYRIVTRLREEEKKAQTTPSKRGHKKTR
jgi:DNA-binding NarL/FixJ family response regulator